MKEEKSQKQRGRDDYGKMTQRIAAPFDIRNSRIGSLTKEHGIPLDTGKGKEKSSSLEPLSWSAAIWIPLFYPRKPISDF